MSATPWNADKVLDRCVPILASQRAPFKVASSAQRLAELNQGAGGMNQAGKFVTVYPLDADQAVRLARALDDATSGMRGPRILSDKGLSPSSLVHYRYADYVLSLPDEGAAPARSAEAGVTPGDPFVAAGLVPEPRVKLIAGRYLITANLHRSLRGAVHLAVDAVERRTCVLKRAWRDAALMPDGSDARDRLREEARILRSLESDPHFPDVWDVVEDDLDLFMVMQHVDGKTFAQVVHELHGEKRPPTDATVIAWGLELVGALEGIHATGLVHRDLNPVNVMVAGTRLCLIDFELAQEQGTRKESYGAGTVGYMSPGQAAGEDARVLDDLYGLGALLFLAATGTDPEPETTTGTGAVIAAAADSNPGLGRALADVIAACLSFDEARVADVASVRADLERALRN